MLLFTHISTSRFIIKIGAQCITRLNLFEPYIMYPQRHVDEPYKTTAGNVIPIDEKLGAVASVRQQNWSLSEVDIQRPQPTGRPRLVGELVVGDIVRHIPRRVVAQEVEIARKSTATAAVG